MAESIFKFEDRDLVNLQQWMRKRPIEFGRAASRVVNTLAFDARRQAISNLENQTTTRVRRFLPASMRVDKSRPRTTLSSIIATVGSIDASKAGRSSGFRELETGEQSKSDRVPTMQARTGGSPSKKVKPGVRFNKISSFHRHTKFPGKNKQAQVTSMLRQIRGGKVAKRPLIIPRGSTTGMPPGIYEKKGKAINLVNPFDGKRGRTKRIAWMSRAAATVASPGRLKKLWIEQANRSLKMRKR